MDPRQLPNLWALMQEAMRYMGGEGSALERNIRPGVNADQLAKLFDTLDEHGEQIQRLMHPAIGNDTPYTPGFYGLNRVPQLADTFKMAPNQILSHLRESIGPVMGRAYGSMSDRANVTGGMGDLAFRGMQLDPEIRKQLSWLDPSMTQKQWD